MTCHGSFEIGREPPVCLERLFLKLQQVTIRSPWKDGEMRGSAVSDLSPTHLSESAGSRYAAATETTSVGRSVSLGIRVRLGKRISKK